MRYILLITCCVLLLACGPTAAPPTPDVPALQTQAAALNAVATARAALIVPTLPPLTQTAGAGAVATIWAGATITIHAIDAQSTQTISAIHTAGAEYRATLTALPTRIVP